MRQLRRRGGRRPALLPVLRSPRVAGAARLPRRAPGPGHPPGSPVVLSHHARGHPRGLRPATPGRAGRLDPPQRRHLRAAVGVAAVPDRRPAARPLGLRREQERRLGREGRIPQRHDPRRGVVDHALDRDPREIVGRGCGCEGQERTAAGGQRSRQRNEGRKSAAPASQKGLPHRTRKTQHTRPAKSTPKNSTPRAPNRSKPADRELDRRPRAARSHSCAPASASSPSAWPSSRGTWVG